MDLNFAIFQPAACPSVFGVRLITTVELFEPGKARCVIKEQLSRAVLADIVSLEENIDRTVEAVSVRDIRPINPALVAEGPGEVGDEEQREGISRRVQDAGA
jgi:hypothetical protein